MFRLLEVWLACFRALGPYAQRTCVGAFARSAIGCSNDAAQRHVYRYTRTYIRAACIHTYIHARTRACIHPYIHTYIHYIRLAFALIGSRKILPKPPVMEHGRNAEGLARAFQWPQVALATLTRVLGERDLRLSMLQSARTLSTHCTGVGTVERALAIIKVAAARNGLAVSLRSHTVHG